jgi:hypothetical protein
MAKLESFPVTVTALPDVTLVEESQISFGTNMFIDANGTCVMDADVPGDVLMQLQRATAVTQATDYASISGSGCVDGGAGTTAGLYTVQGLQGQTVNISIGGITSADFNFSPAGCIGTYEGAASGDTCPTYSGPQTAVAKPLANTTEDSDANVTGGELRFSVGGTITIGTSDLNAGDPYDGDFTVTVVY